MPRQAGHRVRGSTLVGVGLSLGALAGASLTAVALSADAALIRSEFGLSELGIGLLAACLYLGSALSAVGAGRWTDARGPAPVLSASLCLLALGATVAAAAPSTAVLVAGVVVAGFGYGFVNPPTNVLANVRSARRRALAISVKQTGIPIGGAIAGFVIPAVAVVHGWRASLIVPVLACLALAGASSVARLLPRPSSGRDPAAQGVRLRLGRGYLLGFLLGGVQVTLFTFVALYLIEDRHLTPQQGGTALSLLLLGGLLGRVAWGWLSDRMHTDRPRLLQAVCGLSAATLCLLPVAGTGLTFALLPVVGLTAVGWNGVFITAIAEAAPPHRVGVDTARSMVLVNLGSVLVPPAFGAVVATTSSWSAAWLTCAALSLCAVVLLQVSRVPQPVPALVACP